MYFHINKNNEWIKKESLKNNEFDFIISNPPFTGNNEINLPSFHTNYPDYNFQPKQAIKTYDTYGIRPYLSILNELKNTRTKYFLFECNSKNINVLCNKISSKNYKLTLYKIKNKNQFLLVTKN